MIHLDDAQHYLNSTTIYDTGTATTTSNTNASNNSNDNSNNNNTNPIIEQKIKKSSFYIQIFQAIHASIRTTLSTIQSVHKSKLQTWHKRVQQHQQYNKYIDSTILNQPNDSNDAFLRCILNYESGKVLYMLGVTLAKKFTNNSSGNNNGITGNNIFINRICTNEKIQFLDYSLQKFRSSLNYLSTVSSNNNNSLKLSSNNATISHILQSKQQIPTIEREINLSIADTLR